LTASVKVGVEGTGTYGTGLSRFLTAAGVAVREVNRPDRSDRRFRGKTDAVDAEAAARAVLSGQGIAVPKAKDGAVEAIRVLRMVYALAVKDRTAAINQFQAVISTAPEPIRDELADLGRDGRVACVRRERDRRGDSVLDAATRRALKELADRIVMLDEQANRVEADLTGLVETAAAALVDLPGVGVHTAAELLMAAGDNADRIRSEAAFAHLCGAAPIPASSGKTSRHRLNYAGNRAANHALWRIAMARMAQGDPRTIAYVERRTAEGLSKREVIRCLKRYIAREVFRVIVDLPPAAPSGNEIRALSLQLNLRPTR
jgi:transposase